MQRPITPAESEAVLIYNVDPRDLEDEAREIEPPTYRRTTLEVLADLDEPLA